MHPRTRGYLPHLESSQGVYFVTFRLEDSLPVELLARWKEELECNKRRPASPPASLKDFDREYRSKVEAYLDTCAGKCWMRDPRIAGLIAGALRHFNNQRYFLHAWTIMPNHVHVLFTISEAFQLSRILHGWKSFTANQANRVLKRSGAFWQREYFDRLMKSERQFEFAVRYILNNPVKAGFCEAPYQWRWNGCSPEVQDLMKRFVL